MRRILAFAAVSAWALACSPASASTVTSKVESIPDQRQVTYRHTLTLTAAPGERNDVEILPDVDAGLVRFRDAAGLTPTPPCVAQDPTTVACPLQGYPKVVAYLGDGDDRFRNARVPPSSVPGVVHGGAGDDVLEDREGTVLGGPGSDVLRGAILDYSDEPQGVTVDLGAGVSGAAGDRDLLLLTAGTAVRVIGSPGPDVIRGGNDVLRVESGAGDDVVHGGRLGDDLNGGPGDDRLIGGDSTDILEGGPGDDHLEGGRGRDALFGESWAQYISQVSSGPYGRLPDLGETGDDVLDGGPDRDSLNGGPGRDRLLARDGGAGEAVICSSTRLQGDTAVVDRQDDASNCRHVDRARANRLELYGLLRSGPRELRLLVSCPRGAAARACRGRVRLARDGSFASRRSIAVKPGRRVRVPIRLPDADRSVGYSAQLTLATGKKLRADYDGARP